MKSTVNVTSKGQTTIPAPIRRKLGLSPQGGTLDIRFDDARGELVVTKPLSIDELSKKISSYIQPNIKPLTDVDTYYQNYRKSNN